MPYPQVEGEFPVIGAVLLTVVAILAKEARGTHMPFMLLEDGTHRWSEASVVSDVGIYGEDD